VEIATTKNNVLKLPAKLDRPCAFTPAHLEEDHGPRTYEMEHGFPELAARYWADPRIHGYGNEGLMGAFHAAVAPLFTLGLDAFAYGGIDTRSAAFDRLDAVRRKHHAPKVRRAVDLGTGTGTTARALRKRYGGRVVAVDTSPEMLRAARDLTRPTFDFCLNVAYRRRNAERTGLPRASADVAAVFFLLHEAPATARRKILEEGLRLLKPGGSLVVCDIHPDFRPSPIMASGEPYINGYLDNIDAECEAFAEHFAALDRHVVYEGRLVLWTFQLPAAPAGANSPLW